MKVNLTTLAGSALMALSMSSANALVLTNGFYNVNVSDGTQSGSWNATTAASHPVGVGRDLLFNGTTVTTNFSSLRIYSPTGGATTYTWGGAGGGTSLDPSYSGTSASPFGPAGAAIRQTWSIAGTGLTLTQDLIVTGSTFANSAIYHTVGLTNTGNTPLSIGWRNLYDWAVNDPGFDDGPSNAIQIGAVAVVPTTTTEFSYTPAAGSYARVAAAPPPGGGATYEPLLGLGFDPGFIGALPVTLPDAYVYGSWPNSFSTAFDFSPSGLNVTGDSAGLSWFGRTSGSALQIAPGATLRLTQTIYAVAPGQQPPGTVPEPGTLILAGLALVGLAAARRRRT
jgi:PEP-CTERM motif